MNAFQMLDDAFGQLNIDNPEINIKYVNKFLGLLSCEIWYRLFITKEMNSNTTLD